LERVDLPDDWFVVYRAGDGVFAICEPHQFQEVISYLRILAMDTDYTRANARGFSHERVQGEIAPAALCRGLPAGFDAAGYRTRPFTPTQFIKDGHTIDLGGRRLTVLHVPGHTPDAVALVDPAAGLLFTGDSFYGDDLAVCSRDRPRGLCRVGRSNGSDGAQAQDASSIAQRRRVSGLDVPVGPR
jgi:glyoxylase-like metal-dependent hydrolase (beta-lactamase superfamily II)